MRQGHGILGRWLHRTQAPAGCGRAWLLVALLFTLGGCSTSPPERVADAPAAAPPVVFPAERRAEVFTGVTTALRDAGYAIDRADYRMGVVTTEPRPVATVLEPWGGIAQTSARGDQAWAATLGQLQRVVRVAAAADPDHPEAEQLRVEVQLERFAAPTRRVINASRNQIFSYLSAVPEPWARRGITAAYWHPIGRDLEEEARLRAAIAAATTP